MLLRCLAILLAAAQPLAAVTVTHAAGAWTIAGARHTVVFREADFAIAVHAGPVTWHMLPSVAGDMLVRAAGQTSPLRLADARDIHVTPYDTGYKTGIKIVLDRFRSADLRVVLTLSLEGAEEELVAEAVAIERDATLRELHWPGPIDGSEVDYTVIPSDDGTLLPRDWPKSYHPIERAQGDHSIIQSHLIESWAMSWWGFLKGSAAMIAIVETPDDAAYTFSHPAGGPTTMGPSWRAQLGRFAYPRSVRFGFLAKGNYVDMAKRYRRYVQDSGLFVSLREKIAGRPIVQSLIGTPVAGASVLRNRKLDSTTYDKQNPASNYRLTTFAQNIQRLRDLKAKGFEHVNVSLSGWLKLGYDRQTPDALPPPEAAGGWAGMKAFFDACKELGYTCWLHDQYRDYYLDAPSYNPEFAVHDEQPGGAPTAFPGTRFKHDWKDGSIPLMNYWDGGTQAYLNNRFMLGHVVKNYQLMFEHGIHPQGSYQDVFGYIPPDQDFNPEHPSTRTDSMNARAAVFHWIRNNVGIVGTEDGSDWVIPYVDYVTDRKNRSASTGTDPDHEDAIQVPTYELVYHDTVVTTYPPNDLRGLLHGNPPQISWRSGEIDVALVRQMAALHRRVGLLEMTNHEFLDKNRRRERTTFADGTTVTVDWDANRADIRPPLSQ